MSFSKVDILHINESKLDSTVRDDKVYFPGFETVRTDRIINGRHDDFVAVKMCHSPNPTPLGFMHMQVHCFPVSCDIFASRAVIRPERAEQPVSQSQVYSKASREQEKTTSKQMLNRKSTNTIYHRLEN